MIYYGLVRKLSTVIVGSKMMNLIVRCICIYQNSAKRQWHRSGHLQITIKRNNTSIKGASRNPRQFTGANIDKSVPRPTICLRASLFHLFAFVKRDVDYVNSSIRASHRHEKISAGVYIYVVAPPIRTANKSIPYRRQLIYRRATFSTTSEYT